MKPLNSKYRGLMALPLAALLGSCAQAQPAATAIVGTAPQTAKMNVLFIAIDDLNTDLNCYGKTDVKSPNIDRLASQGLLFRRAYCQQAVCSPSRTSLLTGRYPDTTRIYDLATHFRSNLPDVVTLPQYFKNNGYFAQGVGGKIYHTGLEDPQSWDIGPKQWTTASAKKTAFVPTFSSNLRLIQDGEDDDDQKGKKWNDGPSVAPLDVADDELGDGMTAGRAIDAMGALKERDQPFFLAVGFNKPHLPFAVPRKYFEMYPPAAQFELPSNAAPPRNAPPLAMFGSRELRSFEDIPDGETPISADKGRELIRGYRAATSYVDAQVGRVMDELDRLNLRDKTIVVLWGDHGYHLGRNGEWNKHTNFEAATHAPLIISYPGQTTSGQTTDSLAEFVDVYPTLCALAGLPQSPGTQGVSLLPVLNDAKASVHDYALSQYPHGGNGDYAHMGYSLRTDRYRYTEWIKASDKSVTTRELYDHQTDAGETVNIAGQASPALLEKLASQLRQGYPIIASDKPLPLVKALDERAANIKDARRMRQGAGKKAASKNANNVAA